jgi:hypothetical protein
MGATDASRASRALAARADGGPEIENLIGCASCRPPPGTLPPKNACGFECEASCTIDDGVARADVWLSGAAGIGLFPPSLKRAAVALARKHGRVVARLDRAAGDDDEFRFHAHALRGYAALSVGEREGACVLAAVGHAQTLGEQVFTVSLAPRWHDAELPRGEGSGAFYTLVPIRPRWRGERRSLRTLPGDSLRPSLAFNPRPRCLSTPSDAFQLHPAIALYGTTFSACNAASPATRDVGVGGGRSVAMKCAPIARLKAIGLRPVEPAREAAAALERTRTRTLSPRDDGRASEW